MAIILNHTIVPAHDKVVSARFFSKIFGLSFDENAVGYFAPVQVNETLTLDFHDDVDRFDTHHYAFHVSDAEFDAILNRVKEAGLAFGSEPWNLENKELNSWNGGRGVYFRDPNGHILELLTRT
ncbi:MAG: bleomycin resistance protein [Nitrospirae bacterium 13_1_40CM_2_62_10]|nr:MAG: bleomycin resistance protein [Nitrospirae bacterium 13_1_40CM_2_62_10]